MESAEAQGGREQAGHGEEGQSAYLAGGKIRQPTSRRDHPYAEACQEDQDWDKHRSYCAQMFGQHYSTGLRL
jgi:hypothetical protein